MATAVTAQALPYQEVLDRHTGLTEAFGVFAGNYDQLHALTNRIKTSAESLLGDFPRLEGLENLGVLTRKTWLKRTEKTLANCKKCEEYVQMSERLLEDLTTALAKKAGIIQQYEDRIREKETEKTRTAGRFETPAIASAAASLSLSLEILRKQKEALEEAFKTLQEQQAYLQLRLTGTGSFATRNDPSTSLKTRLSKTVVAGIFLDSLKNRLATAAETMKKALESSSPADAKEA